MSIPISATTTASFCIFLWSSVCIQCSSSKIRTFCCFLDNIRRCVPDLYTHQSRYNFSFGFWMARTVFSVVDEQCTGWADSNSIGSGTDSISWANRVQHVGCRSRDRIPAHAWTHKHNDQQTAEGCISSCIAEKGNVQRRRRILFVPICARNYWNLDLCVIGNGKRASGISREERTVESKIYVISISIHLLAIGMFHTNSVNTKRFWKVMVEQDCILASEKNALLSSISSRWFKFDS